MTAGRGSHGNLNRTTNHTSNASKRPPYDLITPCVSTDLVTLKGTRRMADDDRTLFIEAMPDPIRRRIAFDVVERNCRMRFGVGEEGIKAYLRIFSYVQSSKVAEAVEEFKRRFVPMLDQKAVQSTIEKASSPAREGDGGPA